MWSLFNNSSRTSSSSSSFGGGGYSSYASRDLQDYRAHYPHNEDDPRKDKNLLFFKNEYPLQPEGVLIEDVLKKWKGRYNHLESSHSFIQWLFPIQEKGMNWQSQVLQKHEIASMKTDPIILQRVVGVFRVMLDFYGMELVDEERGIIQRLPDGSFEPQYRNLNSSSHNYLRITRMLKNLGEMGFEHLKKGWLEHLFQDICINRLLPNCRSSFSNFWIGTIYDDSEREAFVKSCEQREEEVKNARKKKQQRVEGATDSSPAPTTTPSTPAPVTSSVTRTVDWDEKSDGDSEDDLPLSAVSAQTKKDSVAPAEEKEE